MHQDLATTFGYFNDSIKMHYESSDAEWKRIYVVRWSVSISGITVNNDVASFERYSWWRKKKCSWFCTNFTCVYHSHLAIALCFFYIVASTKIAARVKKYIQIKTTPTWERFDANTRNTKGFAEKKIIALCIENTTPMEWARALRVCGNHNTAQ